MREPASARVCGIPAIARNCPTGGFSAGMTFIICQCNRQLNLVTPGRRGKWSFWERICFHPNVSETVGFGSTLPLSSSSHQLRSRELSRSSSRLIKSLCVIVVYLGRIESVDCTSVSTCEGESCTESLRAALVRFFRFARERVQMRQSTRVNSSLYPGFAHGQHVFWNYARFEQEYSVWDRT